MKKTFQIFMFCSKEVCIPSTDYYAKGNDWSQDEVQYLRYIEEYNSEEEAIKALERIKDPQNEYTILPIYK